MGTGLGAKEVIVRVRRPFQQLFVGQALALWSRVTCRNQMRSGQVLRIIRPL
jgi:hypothetical protein